jgi:diguanylate cyclase (GGDEF)-like protein
VGASVADLVHPDDTGGALRLQLAIADVAGGREVAAPVATRLSAPGRPRWGVLDIAPLAAGSAPDAGEEQWAVLQVDDVTERIDTETQLARQARRDPLTGLANRVDLLEVLRGCLVDHARGGEPVAVLLLDLDRFKLVNDTHGHAVGDELLVDVAGRLRRLKVDTVARLGGDEFALVARLPAGERLELLLRRLHAVLEPVVPLSRGDVVVSASVGVVVHDRTHPLTPGAPDAEGLLRQADIAMYRAKAEGGHRHVVFGEQLQAEVDNRHAIERELRAALTGGGLSVVYQPVVDLEDLHVVGHEALVRLVRRVQGVTVGPAEFLEVAEESGLVKGMGGFVMSTALGVAARDASSRGMAVNVSGRELAEPDFAGRVLRRLGRVGLAPDRLTIEVTESAVVPYLDGVVPQLSLLRQEGVTVALDDFGTGYSSLTHLRALPVDIVKIDRSFVERVVVDGPDRRIVAAVTELATGLGLGTVAEGIETKAQHEVVKALGCRWGQGYLYGRPAADLAPAAAPVAQPAEAGALKAQQYGFESRRGHRLTGGSVASPRTGEGTPSLDSPRLGNPGHAGLFTWVQGHSAPSGGRSCAATTPRSRGTRRSPATGTPPSTWRRRPRSRWRPSTGCPRRCASGP